MTSATNQRASEATVVGSNQEPTVGTQLLPIAASPSNKNAAGSSPTSATVQHIITYQRESTTAQAHLSLATTEPLNRPVETNNGLPGQLQVLPGQTGLTATNSAAAGLFLNNANIFSHSGPSKTVASAPIKIQPRPNVLVTMPSNHVLSDLSSWSFPVVNTAQQSTVTSAVPPPLQSYRQQFQPTKVHYLQHPFSQYQVE